MSVLEQIAFEIVCGGRTLDDRTALGTCSPNDEDQLWVFHVGIYVRNLMDEKVYAIVRFESPGRNIYLIPMNLMVGEALAFPEAANDL